MEKELTTQEKSQVTSLQAKRDQLEKELKDVGKEISKLQNKKAELHSNVRTIEDEIFELTSPFAVGDIVEDEIGVWYRVTRLNYGMGPTRLFGIRLNKNGSESFKDPRTIWAKKLKKVDSAGTS